MCCFPFFWYYSCVVTQKWNALLIDLLRTHSCSVQHLSEADRKPVKSSFSRFLHPDSVCIVSITWKSCQYSFGYLSHFLPPQCSLCPTTHTYRSSYLPRCLAPCLSMSLCVEILFPTSSVDVSHSLPHGLGSVCSPPFCGAQLLCLPGASTGVKPL